MRTLCLAAAAMAILVGCSTVPGSSTRVVATGDAQVGERLIDQYGCGTCHVIPGVARANGTVGPPLTSFGERSYIAGALANNQQNLVRWLTDPQQVEPGTAMPDLGVSEEEAEHISAYLLQL